MTSRRTWKGARAAIGDAWRRLRGGEVRPARAAGSVGIGMFVGFLPFYGIQTLFCLALTVPLKLDFPLAWAVSNFANPLTAAFIIVLDIEVGGFLRTGRWITISRSDLKLDQLGTLLVDAAVGGISIGIVTGVFVGFVTLAWMRRAERLRKRAVVSST